MDGNEQVAAAPGTREVSSATGPPAGSVGFSIDCAERANWLVRRVLQARTYGERVKAWADREVRRAEREEEHLLQRFGPQLRDWVQGELAQPGLGPRRSARLPAGTVGFRRAGPKLVVQDVAMVMAWAREHLPAAIVTREQLDKSAVCRHVRSTGELPAEGVRIEPEHNAFYIR